jgi:hypothetical protein
MKNLDDYNKERASGYNIDLGHQGNNIACPQCANEMKHLYPGEVLLSIPARISVEG